MYYIYIENNEINGAGQCRCLNDEVLNVEVFEDIYNDFCNDPLKYSYANGSIVENPDYELLKQEENKIRRIEQIKLELNDIDSKRIRAVCENTVKDSKTGQTWLEYYNEQAAELRESLNSLDTSL